MALAADRGCVSAVVAWVRSVLATVTTTRSA